MNRYLLLKFENILSNELQLSALRLSGGYCKSIQGYFCINKIDGDGIWKDIELNYWENDQDKKDWYH